jgi:acyl transferase domain-containing protein
MKEAILDRWIAQEKWPQLLDLWIKGLELDWNKLYGQVKPRRIRVPLYPFAKERYWIDSPAIVPVSVKGTSAEALHPLLHTNTSDFGQQSYGSTFSGAEFFLSDHRVRLDGRGVQKVLPGVAYLEMARAAIEHASPIRPESSVLELRNTVWLKPVVVTQSRQVCIALSANDLSANDADELTDGEIDYEISSGDAGAEIVHCQGSAGFGRQPTPPPLDLLRLQGAMTRGKLESASLYALFDQMGLHYGPAHRGVTMLYLGDNQLLAQLHLPEALEQSRHRYLLHPTLLDGALQASVGLIVDLDRPPGEPVVPFSMASLRLLSPCPAEMFAWIRYSPGSKRGDKIVRLDIDMSDRQGNVCVQMRGFSARGMENLAAAFDSPFYQRLIEKVMNDEVSAAEAAQMG